MSVTSNLGSTFPLHTDLLTLMLQFKLLRQLALISRLIAITILSQWYVLTWRGAPTKNLSLKPEYKYSNNTASVNIWAVGVFWNHYHYTTNLLAIDNATIAIRPVYSEQQQLSRLNKFAFNIPKFSPVSNTSRSLLSRASSTNNTYIFIAYY